MGTKSVLYRQYSEAGISPGISDEVRSILASCRDIHLEGNQRLAVEGIAWHGTDYDHRNFADGGEGGGIGDIELIRTCHSLLIGCHFLESYIVENCVMTVEHYVITGTAVGHVSYPVAACIVIHIVAAIGWYLDHIEAASGSVYQYHGVSLSPREGEGLLKENGAQPGGSPYGDGVEAVRNLAIVGKSAKTGVDCIVCIIDRNINRKCVG